MHWIFTDPVHQALSKHVNLTISNRSCYPNRVKTENYTPAPDQGPVFIQNSDSGSCSGKNRRLPAPWSPLVQWSRIRNYWMSACLVAAVLRMLPSLPTSNYPLVGLAIGRNSVMRVKCLIFTFWSDVHILAVLCCAHNTIEFSFLLWITCSDGPEDFSFVTALKW